MCCVDAIDIHASMCEQNFSDTYVCCFKKNNAFDMQWKSI